MTVFYRKYRPQKLAEIFGQEHVTKTLLSQLETGKISHGYLFAGPRGTGKTSTARILAKAVNCQEKQLTIDEKQLTKKSQMSNVKGQMLFGEPCNKCESCAAITNGSHLDLIEIDAASNRGIDEIRDLREKIKLAPVSGKFKVYIIDEAHMLTHEAFNALLKTLEEPPNHAIFILCTTEEQKLPATIVSRLSRFNFRRANDSDLSMAVSEIARFENIKIDKDAIRAILDAADGSYRDAISTLDLLSASSSEIKESDVFKIIKTSGRNRIYYFVENLANKNLKELVNLIEQVVQEGGDIALFNREVVGFLEKLLFIKIGAGGSGDENSEEREKTKMLVSRMNFDDIQNLMKLFLVADAQIKLYPLAQIPMILAVCKYCGEPESVKSSQLTVHSQQEENKQSLRPSGLRQSFSTNKLEQDNKKKIGQEREEIKGISVPSKLTKSTKSLGEVEKHWGEFLNKIKPLNSHVVALLRSSRPLELSDDKLTIEVFYRFHKEKLEESKIISILEKTLGEIMGRKMILKFVLAQRTAVPTREVQMSDVVEIEQEEISKLAAEIFSK